MSELSITHGGIAISGSGTAELRPGMQSNNHRLNQMKTKVFSITPDTATEVCATGDVIFQADKLEDFMSVQGGTAIIQSIGILDDDDNGKSIDIVFMDSTGLLDEGDDGGTIDSDDDSDAAPGQLLGVVNVSNYSDGIAWQWGQKDNIGLAIKAASTTRDIYIAAVNRGASSTWTAAGLHLKIGYIQD